MFAGQLFVGDKLTNTFEAFIAFCFLSSGVYFMNDIVDAPEDRKHPIKSNRPIASGKLPVWIGWISSLVFVFGALTYARFFVGTYFTYALIFYVLVQLFYTLYFRNVIILDSLVVASGFVIRVFAGGLASTTSISSWLALTTIGISLLLAFGKRRSEKTIVTKFSAEKVGTRKTLRHYPDNLLDSMISMSATYVIITYSLFSFQVSPQDVGTEWGSFLPSILKSPKWMMLTIPLVLYGVARYLYVIYEKGEGESPERVLLSDHPLLFTVALWVASVLFIFYLLPVIA